MKIMVPKKRYLFDSQAAYLLSRISHYLVTKINYDELLIFDCDLRRIKIISFPKKHLAAHQVFQNQQNNRLLFELGAEQLQLHTVYAEELRDITTDPVAWHEWVDAIERVVHANDL